MEHCMRKLNRLRIDAGYSIADIARLMQVQEHIACGWLSGTVEPHPEQRRKLARILHVSPDALMDAPRPERQGGDSLLNRLAGSYARMRGDRTSARRNASP